MEIHKITINELMKLTLNRLREGIYFDNKLNPYRKEFLEECLEYFQEKERYTDCILIRDIIKKRFNHENESTFRNF